MRLVGGWACASVSEFASDRGGNFAILSGLLAVPIVLAVGMALDCLDHRQHQERAAEAIDAAVLAVAREGKDVSDDKARAIARHVPGRQFRS